MPKLKRVRRCEKCSTILNRWQKRFCSLGCYDQKGKDKLTRSMPSKYHTRINVDGKLIYLHRFIFEQTHRPLEDGEVVHHKDHNKFNNEPDNLEALTRMEHIEKHRGIDGKLTKHQEEDLHFWMQEAGK